MKWIIGTLAVAVVVTLGIGVSLLWTGSESTQISDAEVLAVVTTSEGNGPTGGIAIHGDWVIEVQNPDGTLAERKEFSNDIQTGNILIRDLAAGIYRAGKWNIILLTSNVQMEAYAKGVCGDLEKHENGKPCQIIQPGLDPSWGPDMGYHNTLTVGTGDDADMVIYGSFEAPNDGDINFVATTLGKCPPTGTCSKLQQYRNYVGWPLDQFFSFHELSDTDKVSVTSGQKINAQVTFRFK